MPTIEFYYMPESFYCRNVEMVAELAGVTLNKHYVNLFTKEQLKDEYKAINPLHKVPFIIDGNVKLCESRAITSYLVNRYMPEDNTLYPKEAVFRAQVDELLHFDGGVLNQVLTKFLTPQIFGKKPAEGSEDEFKEVLSYLNLRLENNGGKKFLIADHLTIGDIAIAATFAFIESCDYNLDDYQSLKSYLQRMKDTIPRYEEINKDAVESIRNFAKSNRKE